MYPFLFRLIEYDDVGCERALDLWVVKIARPDYSFYKSKWMDDPLLGDLCLTISVDLTENVHIFDTEHEAFLFIQQWWAQQKL